MTTTATAAIIWRACPVVPASTDGPPGHLRAHDRARAAAIVHPSARARFLAGRALLDRLVREWRPDHLSHGEIVADRSGRPRVVGVAGLHVSLSHTRELAVAALSTTGDVGVDVEPLARTELPPAAAWLTSAELQRVPSSATKRREELLELWVAKEATLKACARLATVTRRSIEVWGRHERDGRAIGAGAAPASTAARIDAAARSVRTARGQARFALDAGPSGSSPRSASITWYVFSDEFLLAIATCSHR